ncbi:hypothetical protein [Nocardia suismassiliense]|uniref:hypothetical protein n=1 Tax=Nocardia suismassiliense TaxID=2077092 RepID=UPI00131F28E4|nr:hypothetical protein [Nocardia suismassiliense]
MAGSPRRDGNTGRGERPTGVVTGTHTATVAAVAPEIESARRRVEHAFTILGPILNPPPPRWWRRSATSQATVVRLHQAFREAMDSTDDLMRLGLHAGMALRAATAAANALAASVGRPQIADVVVTTLSLTEHYQRRPASPGAGLKAGELRSLLLRIAQLGKWLKAASADLAYRSQVPEDLRRGLVRASELAGGFSAVYEDLAEGLASTEHPSRAEGSGNSGS